jgi:hypothetical protein
VFRLGLSLLLCVNLGGFAASGLYLVQHHDNRDERAGFTLDDVRGHYRGVERRAPLLVALERGHPAELDGAPELDTTRREMLIAWLAGDRISEDFDDLDLGDDAPAEVLAASCLGCHARNADDPLGRALPLEYWDDVRDLAFSREVSPVSDEILLASTHTHAIALGTTSLLLVCLLALTGWPRALKSALALGAGGGLALDLGCWWLAPHSDLAVHGIVIGGVLFAGSVGLVLLAILVDLWRPER